MRLVAPVEKDAVIGLADLTMMSRWVNIPLEADELFWLDCLRWPHGIHTGAIPSEAAASVIS